MKAPAEAVVNPAVVARSAAPAGARVGSCRRHSRQRTADEAVTPPICNVHASGFNLLVSPAAVEIFLDVFLWPIAVELPFFPGKAAHDWIDEHLAKTFLDSDSSCATFRQSKTSYESSKNHYGGLCTMSVRRLDRG